MTAAATKAGVATKLQMTIATTTTTTTTTKVTTTTTTTTTTMSMSHQLLGIRWQKKQRIATRTLVITSTLLQITAVYNRRKTDLNYSSIQSSRKRISIL